MDKKELARRLARESHRSRAQAADDLDALLHSILKGLKRQGKQPEDGLQPTRGFSPASARISDAPGRSE